MKIEIHLKNLSDLLDELNLNNLLDREMTLNWLQNNLYEK